MTLTIKTCHDHRLGQEHELAAGDHLWSRGGAAEHGMAYHGDNMMIFTF